jgi:hypothetical protein
MNKTVSIIPIYKSWKNNFIFDSNNTRDDIFDVFVYLKKYFEEKNIEINTIDLNNKSDYYIFYRLDLLLIIKLFISGQLNNSIYIQLEPPVVMDLHSEEKIRKFSNIFKFILTWNDDLIEGGNFKKLYPPIPHCKPHIEIPFTDKKMLVNISGYKKSNFKNELYSERIKAIKYFEEKLPNDFDLFGYGWNNEKFKSYKGSIDNKYSTLKMYKFSICYENISGMNGLISEKIFDCFNVGVIPIFWGAENIENYIPENCYIDRRKFKDYDELLNFLNQIGEKEYSNYTKSIRNYLDSYDFKKFLPLNHAITIYDSLITNNDKINTHVRIKAIIYLVKYKFIDLYKRIVNKVTRILRMKWLY